MQIETLVVGFLKENCYILTKDNKTLIIDPGAESAKIIDFCRDKNVVGVIITHRHFDHIGALRDIENYFHIDESSKTPEFKYEVIPTPGHAPDAKTYYFPEENVMFTGDFIFNGTIGRTDLPGGSQSAMLNSLEKIKSYPGKTQIYPGHGLPTTLGQEIARFSKYLN